MNLKRAHWYLVNFISHMMQWRNLTSLFSLSLFYLVCWKPYKDRLVKMTCCWGVTNYSLAFFTAFVLSFIQKFMVCGFQFRCFLFYFVEFILMCCAVTVHFLPLSVPALFHLRFIFMKLVSITVINKM